MTTGTVLHNLIFGCVLVFVIQWIFLGSLRSAIIVGVNIPFALFFSIIILVLRGEDANLLSVGPVDFGIIVDSAVILVENIFRNFQRSEQHRQQLLHELAEGRWPRSHPGRQWWSPLDRSLTHYSCQRLTSGQSGLLFDGCDRRRVRPFVHHARRRGANLQSDGANVRLRLVWCVAGNVHRHTGIGVGFTSRRIEETRTIVVRGSRRFIRRCCVGPWRTVLSWSSLRSGSSRCSGS